jgi:hypothetical protein
MRLRWCAYFIPFMFAYSAPLLMDGGWAAGRICQDRQRRDGVSKCSSLLPDERCHRSSWCTATVTPPQRIDFAGECELA